MAKIAFSELVPHIKSLDLPGLDAQLNMAPADRKQALELAAQKAIQKRYAAVSVIVSTHQNQETITLIQRSEYEGVHSGQLAFPGGKKELSDANFYETAVRETQEEIGITLTEQHFVRGLTPLYVPPSNFEVHPYLFVTSDYLEFTPNPREVAAIVPLPLSVLLDDKAVSTMDIDTAYNFKIKTKVFTFGQHTVWGATAMMLAEVKQMLLLARNSAISQI
ncbi:CoA pyrophosphatase [Flavobacterium sp.]|uniref:NUDIX hydrolase n=1 Tax=Flavobacterium sp. TaxID=239 RepID=UPI0026150F25|nr:CoA pyrophosphatase [Flavobacterium sp.]